VAVLGAQLQRNRKASRERGWPDLPRPPVFCDQTSGYADSANVRRAFRRSARRRGLAAEAGASTFSPHGLRHTYAALLLQVTGDVYYTSQQLGHASIELTVGTYGAWHQPHRRPALDVLDRRHDEEPPRPGSIPA
jgi:integrase